MNSHLSPCPSFSPSSSHPPISPYSESSVIDFTTAQHPNSISPPKQTHSSNFKQIIEFQNEQSSEGQDRENQRIQYSHQKLQFPLFDFMGHLLPISIQINHFSPSSQQQPQDSDKQNSITHKPGYLQTPMKINYNNRSPLQDITPSIRKKSTKLSSFTYEVDFMIMQKSGNVLERTPKTMADSRKTDSSGRMRGFRI